jgi:predicted urease superfamily metal-dependent hydrolase
MTLKEMIELVQLHHPHMGETEVVKLINRAKDDFCNRTEIVKTTATMNTVANQRYYHLDKAILKVKSVWLDSIRIPRLIGKPIIDDTDSGEF